MAFKLTNVDLNTLHGKSGKLHVSDQHVVFEGRDGTVTVLATAVKARAQKPTQQVSQLSDAAYVYQTAALGGATLNEIPTLDVDRLSENVLSAPSAVL